MSKKEMKVFKGIELTETMFIIADGIERHFKNKQFTVKQLVEELQKEGKDISLKSATASVARLNTTHNLLKKYEPVKVCTYELKED